jgi:aminoglycoside 6-adenylyltransferase
MRTEQEMMALILGFAGEDERVRVVTMEGSRLNKNAPKDRFQDYDISFLVSNVDSFTNSDKWLEVFGRRIIMQKPGDMPLFPPEPGAPHTYLMLYEDGNRIDLSLAPVSDIAAHFKRADSLTVILLDKDNICPELNEASDADYHVKKPSPEFVDNCCNEFWWLATYVVKGLCRDEMLYAQHHLSLMRAQLLTMVSWKAGIDTGFSVSVGKCCKYLDKYIPPRTWERIMETCCYTGSKETWWKALLECCRLFREASGAVTRSLGYPLPDYGDKVSAYIERFIE